MAEDSTELTEFIKDTLQSIKDGIGGVSGLALNPPVVFDLAVVKTKEAGGRLRIFVVEAGGKYKKEEISRVRFEVGYGASARIIRGR